MWLKLTKSRLILVGGLVLSAFVMLGYLGVEYYFTHTEVVADYGGEYREGVVGKPANLSPLVPLTDVDRDINALVFSGLTKISAKGQLIGDLASEWSVSPDALEYTFILRDDVLWHDGVAFTSDDVVFTIALTQDPSYPGPSYLKNSFSGITVTAVDTLTVKFTLPNPYASFLESTTLGIVPRHVLADVPVTDLLQIPFNTSPVGTGPFMYDSSKSRGTEILSITLQSNRQYYDKVPYLEKLTFRFFANDADLFQALQNKAIDGLHYMPGDETGQEQEFLGANIYKAQLPQYQAVFFNLKREGPTANANVRKALRCAVDQNQLISEVLEGNGIAIDGPLTPNSWAYTKPVEGFACSPDDARAILAAEGYVDGDSDGYLDKDSTILQLSLLTDDNDARRNSAFAVARMWEAIGVKTEVRLFGLGIFIQDYLRKRDFDVALFGQNISWDPDVYAFWHSSQGADPGLNLSQLSDTKIDRLLESGRQLSDIGKRKDKYVEFQQVLRENTPAIFLFSADYFYVVDKSVRNIQLEKMIHSNDRFASVTAWYMETRRVRTVTPKPSFEDYLRVTTSGF